MPYIDFHTHNRPMSDDILAILNLSPAKDLEDDSPFLSYGIHPWDTQEFTPSLLKKLCTLAKNSKVLTIGECGLDKLKGAALDIQSAIFEAHISISEEVKKPLVIHCVKAYSEIIKIRLQKAPQQTWVLHGFNSSMETTQQALKAGFHLSFGPATLRQGSKAHKAMLACPPERLFLETDDSGTDIKKLYTFVSGERKMKLSQLQEQISLNLNHILNIHHYIT